MLTWGRGRCPPPRPRRRRRWLSRRLGRWPWDVEALAEVDVGGSGQHGVDPPAMPREQDAQGLVPVERGRSVVEQKPPGVVAVTPQVAQHIVFSHDVVLLHA